MVNIHKKVCGICTVNFRILLQTDFECSIIVTANVPNETEKELIGKKCLTLSVQKWI